MPEELIVDLERGFYAVAFVPVGAGQGQVRIAEIAVGGPL